MSSGYSATPLPAKLGIKVGHRVLVIDPPTHLLVPGGPLERESLPEGVSVQFRPRRTDYDVALAFCPTLRALTRQFAALTPRLVDRGALWIGWPKRASGIATDLSENVVREHGLALIEQPAGRRWVDVKVAAIDETWSGLKFVRRLESI